VEARTVEGKRVVMLAAVQGDLATPALESIKGAFARLVRTDESAAATLIAAAPPAPYAAGIAIALLAGARAWVGAAGEARCYREHGGVLEPAAGGLTLGPGDSILTVSHAGLEVGSAFFARDVRDARSIGDGDAFSNSTLDAALGSALAHRHDFLAVAVARLAGG
jgi:hypothetical protein